MAADGAIFVQCKPMPGREADARAFIHGNFNPDSMPALLRMSLLEVDSTLPAGRSAAPGPHWVLWLESSDVARMALAVHQRLLGCESDVTGLLAGSWTRYELVRAHNSALATA